MCRRYGRGFGMVCLIAVLAAAGRAEDWAPTAQTLLDEAAKAKRAVGMTAAVWKDGALAWEGATGFADIENSVPARADMVHRIASISKPITATAVMQLVEQGTIDLDAPIQTYVPAFPQKQQGEVLVRHLLSHTSGIRHYKGGAEANTMEHYADPLSALAVFKDDELGFAPGTQFRYSTYGYTVLAAAIERAFGETLRDYMQEHVWGPAGMTSTRFEERGEIVPHRSRGYQIDPKGELRTAVYTDNSVRYAGGGMVSTAGDLARFAAKVQDGTLIKRETLERMLEPIALADGKASKYGLGWFSATWDVLGRVMRHDGGQSGTATDLLVCRDKGIAVAVIANTDADVGVGEVSVMLANLANGTPPPPGMTIQGFKTMAERIKEGNAKKQAAAE